MRVSFAFHLLGIVFWIGGLLFASRIIKIAATDSDSAGLKILAKKTLFGYIVPGLIVTLLTGFYQFLSVGSQVYMKQGWMHAKLLLVAVLLWSTFSLAMALNNFISGSQFSAKTGTVHHGIVAAGLLAILILTFVKPF